MRLVGRQGGDYRGKKTLHAAGGNPLNIGA